MSSHREAPEIAKDAVSSLGRPHSGFTDGTS
jgi:hypothetical protein